MIKSLTKEDASSIYDLIQKNVNKGFWPGGESWSSSSVNEEFSSGRGLGQWEEGRLIAFLFYRAQGDAYEIMSLATDPQWQGKGQMRALFASLFQLLRVGKEVSLEVHEENYRAQQFYKTLGFQQVGIRPRYYGGQAQALIYVYKCLQ